MNHPTHVFRNGGRVEVEVELGFDEGFIIEGVVSARTGRALNIELTAQEEERILAEVDEAVEDQRTERRLAAMGW